MIVTQKFIENLDKKTLTDLASDYATQFAHLLGHDEKIRIKQEELIYERKEARDFFLRKFEPKNFPKSMRKLAKLRYNNTKNDINQGNAFVQEGIAFIPISDLSNDEKGLVERLNQDKPTDSGWYTRILRMFSGKNNNYASLSGFGSEIAHLVGDKIYQGKVHNGLGEALDFASQTFELSKNVKFLCNQTREQPNSKVILNDNLDEYISNGRNDISFYEIMLFEGDTAAKQKLNELGVCKVKNIDVALNSIKKEYVTTYHYDGTKLFIEIFDSVNGDLSKVYRKLGNILANPKVTNMETALRELGYTHEKLLSYHGCFGKNMLERVQRLY